MGLALADSEDVATTNLAFGAHRYVVGSTYDVLGRRTSVVFPEQLRTAAFVYGFDEFGELDSASNNLGGSDRVGVNYHYDARGRIDTVRFSNGIVDARAYDADDRLVQRLQVNSQFPTCTGPLPSTLCWAYAGTWRPRIRSKPTRWFAMRWDKSSRPRAW